MKKLFAVLFILCVFYTCSVTAFAATDQLPDEILDVLDEKWDGWTVPSETYKTANGKYEPDNDSPASYYYDEHGHAAAVAVISKNGKNRMVILEKKNGEWKVVASSISAVLQGEWIPSISCETYGQFDIHYSSRPYAEPIYCAIEREDNGQWYFTRYEYSSEENGRIRIWISPDCLTFYSDENKKTNVYGVVENRFQYFTLASLPKTVSEARASLTNPPKIPEGTLSATRIKFTSGKKYEVYQGPGKEYGRAANGKAAVSTNDWIQVFGEENGFIMIQYDISKEQYRIGWIDAKSLPKKAQVEALSFQPVHGYLVQQTFLTDDPLNSKKSVVTLEQGTEVRWLASMGDWAYIETTTGTLIRGFVPVSSIEVPQNSAVRYDVMEDLAGYWVGVAGGEMFYDSVMLYADGTYAGWMGTRAMEDTYEVMHGNWRVTDYDAAAGLYWNNPPYEITFERTNMTSRVFGLTTENDAFSITTDEGGYGYERQKPPVDDPNYEPDVNEHG